MTRSKMSKLTAVKTNPPDPLQTIETSLKEHYGRFGITSEQLKALSIPGRVKKILDGYYSVLDRLAELGRAQAKRAGVAWDASKTTLDNLELLLGRSLADSTSSPQQGSDAELARAATTLNQQLLFPFSRLPNDGAAAFKMVMTQLEHQQKGVP